MKDIAFKNQPYVHEGYCLKKSTICSRKQSDTGTHGIGLPDHLTEYAPAGNPKVDLLFPNGRNWLHQNLNLQHN
jgi:hypothetical protein